MNLIDQAQADTQVILGNNDEWGKAITLTAPDGTVANINGLHVKVGMGITPMGQPANVKTARITFSEAPLTALGYPVRNGAGEVYLKGHLVSVKDSTGFVKQYNILTWLPDETIGMIVCMLGDYQP